MPQIKEVFFSDLLGYLIKTRDIHKLVDSLEKRYNAIDFEIRIPLHKKKIFIFQSREFVSKVLKKQTRLPFVNKNFDLSHGHPNSINAVNTTEPLWHDLHYGLSDIFEHKPILPIMEKYQSILFRNNNFCINTTLEEYFLHVWGEYCFGPVSYFTFKRVRNSLIETLCLVFHNNHLNRLPWIGHYSSLRNFQKHRRELGAVDNDLSSILQNAVTHQQGVFYELYKQLESKYPNAFQIALDNSFLGILVYDFIYTVLLDAIVKIAKNPDTNRFLQIQKSMHSGFLYPFRFRTAEENFDSVKSGDYCIINLQQAGLYFSSGSRYCVGQSLFRQIYQKFLAMLSDYNIQLTNPTEKIRYNGSLDIPIMLSQHLAKFSPARQTTIQELRLEIRI